MENKAFLPFPAATNSLPHPAAYPLGSEASRAAARALLTARVEEPDSNPLVTIGVRVYTLESWPNPSKIIR